MDLAGAKDVQVWLKRSEHWLWLEQFDAPKLLKKDPYYIIRDNQIIFLNSKPSDYYSIEVYR